MGFPPLKVTDQESNSAIPVFDLNLPSSLRVSKSGIQAQILGAESIIDNIFQGDNVDFRTSVGDWLFYNDGDVEVPIDGTGGAPGNLAVGFTDSTTTPLSEIDGDTAMVMNKSALSTRGQGAESSSQAVPVGLRGKTVQLSFDYKDNGNYINNFYKLYAYDVTNSVLLSVNVVGGEAVLGKPSSTSDTLTFYGSVDIPSDCENIRVMIHCTTTDATAHHMYFTNFRLGRIDRVNGATKTEALINTATGSHGTSGSWLAVAWTNIVKDEFGSFDGTTFTANKDMSLTVRGSLAFASNSTGKRGVRVLVNGTGQYHGNRMLAVSGSPTEAVISHTVELSAGDTFVIQGFQDSGGSLAYSGLQSRMAFELIDNGAVLSTAQANFSALRMQADLSANQIITTTTTPVDVIYDQVNEDTAGIYNNSTGVATIPEDGFYIVLANVRTAAQSQSARVTAEILLNGSTLVQAANSGTDVSNPRLNPFYSGPLSAGDLIKVTIESPSDGDYRVETPGSYLSIIRQPDLTVFGVTGVDEFEEIEITADTDTITGNVPEDVAGSTMTVPPGTHWLEFEGVMFLIDNSGVSNNIAGKVQITDSANNLVAQKAVNLVNVDANGAIAFPLTFRKRVTITESTDYKLRVVCSDSTATGIARVNDEEVTTGLTGVDSATYFRRERIK